MIKRLSTIVGAYLAACVGAGFTSGVGWWLTMDIEHIMHGWWPTDAPTALNFAYLVLLKVLAFGLAIVIATWFGSLFVAVFAFLPAVVVITIAEARGLRSAAFYAGAGLVAALAILQVRFRGPLLETPRPDWLLLLWGTIGASVGSLIYWRIAGRTAGTWRIQPREEQP